MNKRELINSVEKHTKPDKNQKKMHLRNDEM